MFCIKPNLSTTWIATTSADLKDLYRLCTNWHYATDGCYVVLSISQVQSTIYLLVLRVSIKHWRNTCFRVMSDSHWSMKETVYVQLFLFHYFVTSILIHVLQLILIQCVSDLTILSQSYNTSVFYFDNISFLGHVLNQLFLPNERSINQASSRTVVLNICFQLFKKQTFLWWCTSIRYTTCISSRAKDVFLRFLSELFTYFYIFKR